MCLIEKVKVLISELVDDRFLLLLVPIFYDELLLLIYLFLLIVFMKRKMFVIVILAIKNSIFLNLLAIDNVEKATGVRCLIKKGSKVIVVTGLIALLSIFLWAIEHKCLLVGNDLGNILVKIFSYKEWNSNWSYK